MESGDPNIYATLGAQSTAAEKSHSTPPVPLFYILLGLVFEALTTSTPSTRITRDEMVTIALRALSCLMQHRLSGDALGDPTVFEEIVNLFYRMALTEPLPTQVYLLKAIASFSDSLSTKQM